jgi:hypothetical protein
MIIVGTAAPSRKTTTVLDLIKGALRPLNVLTGNTTLTDAEAQDALEALNWMLDSWSNEPQAIYHVQRITATLTAGRNPHTFGPGGDIDEARPQRIVAATIHVGSVDYPLAMLGFDDWEAIRWKNLQTAWPLYGYLEPTYPLASLYLWPISTGGAINMQTEFALTSFTDLTDEVSLPPGYADAIRYNLALRLAPEYQVTAGPDVLRMALGSLNAIKRANNRPLTMAIDPVLRGSSRGRYNVFSDGSR